MHWFIVLTFNVLYLGMAILQAMPELNMAGATMLIWN